MSEVKVTLKDGSVKEFAAGTSYLEIAKSLNQKLGKQALLAPKKACMPSAIPRPM